MKVIFKLLFILVATLQVVQAKPPFPENFSATYDVSKNGFSIAQLTWRLNKTADGKYIFSAITEATGLASIIYSGVRTETSHWKYINNEISPVEYNYSRSDKPEHDLNITFDSQNHLIKTKLADERFQYKQTPALQDKLSYILSIMNDLSIRDLKQQYQITTDNHARSYKVRKQKAEIIDTALGKYKTVQIHKQGKRTTTLWCAAKLDYLPLRILHTEPDGGSLKMEIKQISGF